MVYLLLSTRTNDFVTCNYILLPIIAKPLIFTIFLEIKRIQLLFHINYSTYEKQYFILT